MVHVSARWLGVLVSFALLFATSGCGMFGKKTYDLEVKGNPTDDVLSLFVIVASEEQLGDTSGQAGLKKVINSDQASNFKVFAQYEPQAGASSPWTELSTRMRQDWIEIEVGEKEPEVTVKVKKKRLKDFLDHSVLVVVSTRKSYFGERVSFAEMNAKDAKGVKLFVRESTLDRELIE